MTNVVVHLSGATARYSQIAHGTRRVLDKLPEAVLKDIGLARSDIPFIGGKLADKCKDPARDAIDRFDWNAVWRNATSSVCQRPSFASRWWQQPLFLLFSSFHPSWLSGWFHAEIAPRKRGCATANAA